MAETGDRGAQVLAVGLNSFSITNTVTCDDPEPGPPPSAPGPAELTLLKAIRNPFTGVKTVPLTSWTLTARGLGNGNAVVRGRTG